MECSCQGADAHGDFDEFECLADVGAYTLATHRDWRGSECYNDGDGVCGCDDDYCLPGGEREVDWTQTFFGADEASSDCLECLHFDRHGQEFETGVAEDPDLPADAETCWRYLGEGCDGECSEAMGLENGELSFFMQNNCRDGVVPAATQWLADHNCGLAGCPVDAAAACASCVSFECSGDEPESEVCSDCLGEDCFHVCAEAMGATGVELWNFVQGGCAAEARPRIASWLDDHACGRLKGCDARAASCDGGKAKDSKSWSKKGKSAKTCEWVRKKPDKRCSKKSADGTRATAACPKACGEACDDPFWSMTNKKNKKITCDKVARNPARRCKLAGAAGHCAATCAGH